MPSGQILSSASKQTGLRITGDLFALEAKKPGLKRRGPRKVKELCGEKEQRRSGRDGAEAVSSDAESAATRRLHDLQPIQA